MTIQNGQSSEDASLIEVVEVAINDTFDGIVASKTVEPSAASQTTVTLDTLPPADYYWRIRTVASVGTSVFSRVFKFTIPACGVLLTGTSIFQSDADLGSGSACLAGRVGFRNDVSSSRRLTLIDHAEFCPDGHSVTWLGPMDGSGSLTVAAGGCDQTATYDTDKGTVILGGNNTFTGGLNLFFSGVLVVQGDENLGAPGMLFTTTGLPTLRPAGSFSSNRPMSFDGGLRIDTSGNDVLLSGPVQERQPSDSVYYGGILKEGSGTLTLTGTNTYEFGTTVSGGTLAVGMDASLGSTNSRSRFITLAGGTLKFLQGFTTDRGITIVSPSTIDTGSNDVTITGPVRGTGALTKTGNGTLTLTGAVSLTGGTIVLGGRIVVSNGQ